MKTNDHQNLGADALALLAHELRTPLTALMGYTDAMRGQVFGPLHPPYDEHARIIHKAAEHLLALVDDMTSAAQAEAGVWTGSRERFDPRELVETVEPLLRPRAARAGVRMETFVDPHLDDIFADRRAIRQVLINLLDNALKHTAEGGEVNLVMDRDGDHLRLVVTDSGGADPEAARGTGLGLKLAQAIGARHGGTLDLNGRTGGGMTATMRLAVSADR